MGLHVWIAGTKLPNMIPRATLELLDERDVATWKRLRSSAARRQFLISRAVLRQALSRLIGDVDPGDWRFDADPDGRPRLSAEHGLAMLDFNISRSGEAIIVAISTEGRVGVDVERLDSDRDENAGEATVALDSAFSDGELAALERRPLSSSPREDALRLWTVKEAYAKLVGIDPELKAFEVEVRPAPWRILKRDARAVRSAPRIRFATRELRLGPSRYHVALASSVPGDVAPRLSFHEWRL